MNLFLQYSENENVYNFFYYCQKSGIVCIIHVKVTLLLSRPFHVWLPVLIHIG